MFGSRFSFSRRASCGNLRRNRQRCEFESLESRQLLAADIYISEFVADNDDSYLDGDGDASDWVEFHNRGDEPVDLAGWSLSDDVTVPLRFRLPSLVVGPGEYVVVFASGKSEAEAPPYVDSLGHVHANFRLSSQGESILLADSTGSLIDSVTSYPQQRTDVGYGLGGNGIFGYLLEPTPGAANDNAVVGFVDAPQFNFDRGFYDAALDLIIESNTPGSALIVTMDGSLPSVDNGTVFPAADDVTAAVAQIPVETTSNIRAVAVKDGWASSSVQTQSYIFINDVIRQPREPEGLPDRWNGIAQATIRADYEMDPDVVDDPDYTEDLLKGLREIPTISLVLDQEDMFGDQGIYINSGQRGRDWERASSVEIIEPSGTHFQADTGVRIHGFSWRFHSNTPKHSFRLEFRDEYGPTKLEYPLFPDSPVDKFDSIVLRAQGGRAWAGNQNPHEAQYLRDTFARDLSREMGRTEGHATLVHLYINGLYWGLYNPVERPDAQMGEEYFGGSQEDYDALNRRTSTVEVIDGDRERYDDMMRIVNRALRDDELTDEQYQQLERYVEIDQFIDFMMVNQYVTNRDGLSAFEGNNQRAIGHRSEDAKFHFFVWDMEYSLWNATDNNNVDVNRPPLAGSNNPSNGVWALYKALRLHPDFRIRYADHAQEHLFHDGALTPEKVAQTWETRAESIENAVVAESARWGDAKRSRPYTRDVEWQRERERLLNTYFPNRSSILVEHLQEAGLYSDTVVPEYFVNGVAQHGGAVEQDSRLTLQQDAELTAQARTLIHDDANVQVRVPQDDRLGQAWLLPEFQIDEQWTSGQNGVGFDTSGDYDRQLNLNLRDQMRDNASVYVRLPFAIADADELSAISKLTMPILIDDGFVAYLNGTEVASVLAPDQPQWNSAATGASEADLNEPLTFDLTPYLDQLRVGDNVLAIHGMNAGTASGDMIVHAELIAEATVEDAIWYTTDGSDPRLPGGAINNAANGGTALLYRDSIELAATTHIKARTVSFEGNWSALNQATFVVGTPVVLSELHYNPLAPTDAENAALGDLSNEDFEFVELYNPTDAPLNLAGAKFVDGIELEFPADARLEPGQFAVVVNNAQAFRERYGDDTAILAEYAGRLANDGERLVLVDALDQVLADFEYNDSELWPQAADGVGASLEVADTTSNGTSSLSSPTSWKHSQNMHGTPGRANSETPAVIVNEVLARPSGELQDSIELYNRSDAPVDVGGWYLSDSANQLLKYQIPDGTVIGAGDYWVVRESAFNAGPNPDDPLRVAFALSGTDGDEVWLVNVDDQSRLTTVVDQVSFGASRAGEAFGRVLGDLPRLLPVEAMTFGEPNAEARVGPMVVSEVHYQPAAPSEAALAIDPELNAADLEFIEIWNTGTEPVNLLDWQLDGGVSFSFPATILLPGGRVVVTRFDPTAADDQTRLSAFLAEYGIDENENVMLVGGYEGALGNAHDRIELLGAERISADATELVHPVEDFVFYLSTAPWPDEAAGLGDSLQRGTDLSLGGEEHSWYPELPNPGSGSQPFTDGDLNQDQQVDEADLGLLCAAIQADDLTYDLNQDGEMNVDDQIYMVRELMGTAIGDANLDGRFDSQDLVLVFQVGAYENDVADDAMWSTGDWDCDGEFSSSDLVLAFQFGEYRAG